MSGLLRLGPPLDTCTSTNELCRGLVLAGAPEGTTVQALEQTAGRGRDGRPWHSPRGLGLWLSFCLRPRRDRAVWPSLTAVTALALAEAIESMPGCPPGFSAGIKWPNDLFGARGKVAGILAEAAEDAIVIGIGVNLGQKTGDFAPAIRPIASSLRLEGFDPAPAPSDLAAVFDRRMTAEYARFESREPDFLQEGLRRRFHLRAARVRIEASSGEVRWAIEGTARDVGPQGELVVDTGAVLRSVVSGEVVSYELPR